MASIWLYTISSVFIVSLVSLVGVFTMAISLEKLKKILLFLVSFAAGALLGDAFIHLIPEVYSGTGNKVLAPFFILLGSMLFFALEKVLWWHHCHETNSENHAHPMAINNIVGDGLHNAIDGMIIAGSFIISIPLGLTTAIAVILHEIPHEIGNFSILIFSGWSRKKALVYNFFSGWLAMVGAIIILWIGHSVSFAQNFLAPFTVGGFIYIAMADLLPELKKEENLGKSAIQLTALLFGIGIMAAFLLLG